MADLMKRSLPYVALALALFGCGFLWAKSNGDKAVLKERLRAETEKATVLIGQIEAQAALIAKGEAALAKHDAAAAARERWFQGQLAHVSTATPQELVDDGSRLLGASDISISIDGKNVSMGLGTWRGAVSIMLNEEEYRLVREPAWITARGLLQDQIAGFKQERILDARKDAALAASISDLKKFIASRKASTLLDKVLWAGAGAGAGLIAGSVLK
jgi:hypothetical protein